MSDSDSDIPVPNAEEFPEAKSRESVSTENDTEADIEEMSSIADEEAPIVASEQERNDPVTPVKAKDNQSIEPKNPPKPAEPPKPIDVKEEPVIKPKVESEKVIKEPAKQIPDQKEEVVENKSQKSAHTNGSKKSQGNSKSVHVAEEPTKVNDGAEHGEGSVTDKTLTPANVPSSKSQQTTKPSSHNNYVTTGHSEVKSPQQTKESRTSHPSNGEKKSATSKTGTQRAPSKTSKYRSSSSNNKQPTKKEKGSSSYTTHARAETTPTESVVKPKKHHREKDFHIVSVISENGTITASSGLQSLREMFFDEHDSHKGYFSHNPADKSSYCSHQHRPTTEHFSRISNPSFNSHLEPSPIYAPDIDQTTFNKGEQTDECTTESDIYKEDESESPKNKRVDFVAGSDATSLSLNGSEKEYMVDSKVQTTFDTTEDDYSVASEHIVRDIDRKYLSFTPNTLLCDLSNIIPNHNNLVTVEGRHILNKEVCLEFMCWMENLNDLYMTIDYGKALNIFRRQESRFKIVLYESLKIAQGCGLDIEFERVASMAHIAFDVIYTMLPYCDGIKWYSQMVAGAKKAENRLAEAYMLLCVGLLMVHNGDSFEAQRHLQAALIIVKKEYADERDLANCIKHVFGLSVALCDTNTIKERECGLIKMTEALVMTRNLYGSTSLEAALSRHQIGVAYKHLYEDTALRLEGLDYVERAHEVLEDKLGHHPYMGKCVETLAQYHDVMIHINFNTEYTQALKCYNLSADIHRTALGGHNFTVRALTEMGDFYHRMADYRNAGSCLTEAHTMATEYCPTDIVFAIAAFYLGLFYMDEQCPEHDIYRGQGLLTSAANLMSKYGVTYQRATMLLHMAIASEEAGLKYTFYQQESDNIKSAMFGAM